MKLLLVFALVPLVKGNIRQDILNEQCSREHGSCDENQFENIRVIALRSSGCKQFCQCDHDDVEGSLTYYWVLHTCPPGTLFDDSLPSPVCNHEDFVECPPLDLEKEPYYGTYFVTGFMKSGGIPTLLIACPQPETIVKVSIPTLNIQDEEHICLDGGLILKYSATLATTVSSVASKKGVSVTANYPIMLFRGSFALGTTDGSLVLPELSLGTDYIISSYHSTLNGIDEFLIVGTTDNTSVIININSVKETINLNKLETYMRSGVILTGSTISSSAPVFVLSGNLCANIPNNNVLYCDYIEEAMTPINSLGLVHVVSFMHPRPDFTISIVAAHNETSISIYDADGNKLEEIASMVKADAIFRSYTREQTISVIANKPILVTQYGHGSNGKSGDPSMMTISDVSHFGTKYDFVVPDSFIDPSTLAIVMSESDASDSLLLNGVPFVPLKNISISVPGNGKYMIFYGSVLTGYNNLVHASNMAVPFGAWIYGFGQAVEYAWPLGRT